MRIAAIACLLVACSPAETRTLSAAIAAAPAAATRSSRPSRPPELPVDSASALPEPARDEPAPAFPPRSVHGVVRDELTGEPLPGVTVVVATGAGAWQAALTDASGAYLIADLPAGRFDVTMYFFDRVVELPDVDVGDVASTELDPTIEADATVTPEGEYVSFPVPGQTCAVELGGSADEVSFSGCVGTIENTYVVDD